MVKVCCCCSKVDVDALKIAITEARVEVGCIEQCQGFNGKSFGIIDGELVTAENSDAFIKACL
mgnify:CR=1 FL=1